MSVGFPKVTLKGVNATMTAHYFDYNNNNNIFNLETLKLKGKGQKMFVHFGKLVQLGDQKFATHLMRTAYNKLRKRKSYTIFTTEANSQ